MDEAIDKEKLAAFLNNPDGHYPTLEDLPRLWDLIPPDARDPKKPNFLERDVLLMSYLNWSFTKSWAFTGLERLLSVLLERGEPIPKGLQLWANTVASGRRKLPPKRGRPNDDDRDERIIHAVRILRHQHGYSREAAINEIAEALNLQVESIQSILRKMAKAEPFPRGKKGG